MNAISLYRVARWLYLHKIPILPKIIYYLIFLIFNSSVPYTASIGKESRFAYGGIGCVINKRSKIGERVLIGQNTTIGRSLNPDDYPSIGNDVYISAGARIIGNIHVGNNVIIGANAVVNKDIEDNSIVAGVPAKVIRTIDRPIWEMLQNIRFKSLEDTE
jgi:serine O-acetyltransferase